MPLYFFLSGIFFKTYGGLFPFVKKKANKLLIPFFFFYISFSVIFPWCIYLTFGTFLYIDSYPTFWQLLMDFYYNHSQLINGPLWFLLCLFEINIMFFILQYLFEHHKLYCYIGCIICGIIGLLISYMKIRLPISIDTALTCMPFFGFGYYVRHNTQLLNDSIIDRHLLLGAFICGLFVLLLSGHVMYLHNSFSHISYFTAHLCGILGTLMIILLSKHIGTIPLVSYFGRYSIIILCTHILLLKPFVSLLMPLMPTSFSMATLLFFMIIICELALIPFFRIYLPHMTAQKDLIP